MLPVEISAMTREQDENGLEVNNDTDDIFVVPFQYYFLHFRAKCQYPMGRDSLVQKEKAYRIIVDLFLLKKMKVKRSKVSTLLLSLKNLFM